MAGRGTMFVNRMKIYSRRRVLVLQSINARMMKKPNSSSWRNNLSFITDRAIMAVSPIGTTTRLALDITALKLSRS